MLQPLAVHIIEVTALKLLLAVVGHRHRDERVHAVKPPLMRKTDEVKNNFRNEAKTHLDQIV